MTSKGPTSCFTCQGRNRSEWCDLDGEDLELLNRAKTCNTYRQGQVIFYQGNACFGIHCVEEGTVALRRSDPGGESVIARLFHAGSTLGYAAYFSGRPYAGTAEALTEARICFIDKSALRILLDRSPSLGHQFLDTLARSVDEADDAKLRSATLPVRARLAHLLLVLKDRFGRVSDDGELRFELPLSRQDMGALLNARPESISRAVRELESDGVVTFRGRSVLVPDLDPLLDEIESRR